MEPAQKVTGRKTAGNIQMTMIDTCLLGFIPFNEMTFSHSQQKENDTVRNI